MTEVTKGQLVLISGESSTGKSMSLENIPNHERWAYCNTESGKDLPFKHNYQFGLITDPYQIGDYFEHVTKSPDFDGIIIDSLTFLMDMYESLYVLTAADSRGAWGDFAQYFKVMMQQQVAKCLEAGKHVVFLAHTKSERDAALVDQVSVPIKGSLKGNGVEAYFTTVVSTKAMTLEALEPYKSELLNISEEDEIVGLKYVFQTRKTKATVGERIRGPRGLFEIPETFIDNDVNILLERLKKHYA